MCVIVCAMRAFYRKSMDDYVNLNKNIQKVNRSPHLRDVSKSVRTDISFVPRNSKKSKQNLLKMQGSTEIVIGYDGYYQSFKMLFSQSFNSRQPISDKCVLDKKFTSSNLFKRIFKRYIKISETFVKQKVKR